MNFQADTENRLKPILSYNLQVVFNTACFYHAYDGFSPFQRTFLYQPRNSFRGGLKSNSLRSKLDHNPHKKSRSLQFR